MKIKLSLKYLLLALAFVPFIAFIGTSYSQFRMNLSNLKTIKNQQINSDYMVSASELIYNLQKERTLSAVNTKTNVTNNKLKETRTQVDLLFNKITDPFYKTKFSLTQPDRLKNITITAADR